MSHDAVDVALDQQCAVLRLDRRACEVGPVEQVALGVERGLRRVELLPLLVPEPATAEGDDPALKIADREQEASAEAVVGASAILARDRQARGDQRLLRDLLGPHEGEQRLPPLGRVAEAEMPGDPGVDPALAEIRARPLAGWLPERVREEAPGELHHVEELLAARVAAPGPVLVGQRDPGGLRQGADRFGEREAILAHDEAEGVAPDATAEAVENALSRIDRERRCFLGMERAEPLPVGSGLAKVHEPADEVDDVDGGSDVVEQGLRILHLPDLQRGHGRSRSALRWLTVAERLDQRVTGQEVADRLSERAATLPMDQSYAREARKKGIVEIFLDAVPRLVAGVSQQQNLGSDRAGGGCVGGVAGLPHTRPPPGRHWVRRRRPQDREG